MIKVSKSLENYKESMAKAIYNMTKEEAHSKGICLECKKPAFLKCYSKAGRKEYQISGLCERCFDKIYKE